MRRREQDALRSWSLACDDPGASVRRRGPSQIHVGVFVWANLSRCSYSRFSSTSVLLVRNFGYLMPGASRQTFVSL